MEQCKAQDARNQLSHARKCRNVLCKTTSRPLFQHGLGPLHPPILNTTQWGYKVIYSSLPPVGRKSRCCFQPRGLLQLLFSYGRFADSTDHPRLSTDEYMASGHELDGYEPTATENREPHRGEACGLMEGERLAEMLRPRPGFLAFCHVHVYRLLKERSRWLLH